MCGYKPHNPALLSPGVNRQPSGNFGDDGAERAGRHASDWTSLGPWSVTSNGCVCWCCTQSLDSCCRSLSSSSSTACCCKRWAWFLQRQGGESASIAKCLFLPLQEMPGLSCIEFFAGKAVIAAAWQARGYAAKAMDVLRASAQTEVVLR